MFFNYLKIAFRMLVQQRWHTALHIVGLSIGIACALLVAIYISHEISFEKFNTNAEQTYRINYKDPERNIAITPNIVGPLAKRELAAVEEQTRVMVWGGLFFTLDGKSWDEKCSYADSTFFNIFSFKMLEGDPLTALNEPNEVVLTESLAIKYFGEDWYNREVLGQVLMVDNKESYKISGVMEDLPTNTDFSFDMLVSFYSLSWAQEEIWGNANYFTFIKVTPSTQPEALEKELIKLCAAKQDVTVADLKRSLFLQPLLEIHNYAGLHYDFHTITDIQYLYIFGVVALLLLSIACINYINLATARAVERAREVGVRKVMGAQKNQLLIQFLGESLFITLASFTVALLLSWYLLPYVNVLTDRDLSFGAFFTVEYAVYITLLMILVTLLAGGYPALVLSSYRPVIVLKKNFKASRSGAVLRKSLIIFQYAASILLLACTLTVKKQIDYIQNKEVGFDKQVFIHYFDDETMGSQSAFRSKLMQIPGISQVAFASDSPESIGSVWSIKTGAEKDVDIHLATVDEYYLETCKIPLVAGRNFTKNIFPFGKAKKDSKQLTGYILNQKAIQLLGFDEQEALGEIVSISDRRGEIIGIVQDFNFESLHLAIEPLAIAYDKERVWKVLVNLEEQKVRQVIPQIQDVFKEIAPAYPFEYEFVSESFNQEYKNEERLATASSVLTAIAIIVACLGLLGLTSFTTLQRTKEIGIRKVLGATVVRILTLLSKSYFILLIVASSIAIPLAWYLMGNWLNNYTFRIELNLWIVLLPISLITLITLSTVGIQLFKTAQANPVDALRSE
ncbi:MAG: FtsX-like permease family protein [Bacteroidota bacterium]